MAKSILFTFRHAPYGTSLAREGLEALLAAAVYEQDIAVLFLNDGVWQLVPEQESGAGVKNHARMLMALPIYGVNRVYVHEPSLQARGLMASELLLDPARLSSTQTQDLLQTFDQILSF